MQGEDEVLRKLGRAIAVRRRQLGLSQERFSEISGIHRVYIGDVERGERNLSTRNVARIAAALDLTISELFTRAGL